MASAMSMRVALVSVLAAALLTIGWQRTAILKELPIPNPGRWLTRSPFIRSESRLPRHAPRYA